MIDGTKLNIEIYTPEQWGKDTGIDLRQSINKNTGEIISTQTDQKETIKYYADYRGYKLQIKEVFYNNINSKRYFLEIKGSFHKSYFEGTNYQKFYFEMLQTEILTLCRDLRINPYNTKILNLEIGVNIPFWTQPNQWLKENVLRYKTSQFNAYKPVSNGVPLGYYCELSQYAVKMYDKGIQNELSEHLFRIEKKFYKMQSFKKYNISVLADLQDKAKCSKLIDELTAMVENTIIVENIPDIDTLNNKQRNFYLECCNPLQWDKWCKNSTNIAYQNKKKRYNRLIELHSERSGKRIVELINKEWQTLLVN